MQHLACSVPSQSQSCTEWPLHRRLRFVQFCFWWGVSTGHAERDGGCCSTPVSGPVSIVPPLSKERIPLIQDSSVYSPTPKHTLPAPHPTPSSGARGKYSAHSWSVACITAISPPPAHSAQCNTHTALCYLTHSDRLSGGRASAQVSSRLRVSLRLRVGLGSGVGVIWG